MKILLDAGHGPETPGKRSPDGRLREFSFNQAVAVSVARYLTFEGMSVTFSHRPERDVPLGNRISLANKTNVDAFVSIHANAYGTTWNDAKGIETFVYPTASKQSFALAKGIQQSMIIACNRVDRGVKTANFAVLRETRMPAVLVECGFMTNREEATLLMQKAYREQCAKAIAFAILSWKYRGKS
ncbi:N-acetylmuramoyl-L-alanine amidase [Sporosarcina sp. HYO08]|uniref:N-acetylmuramoyl-L-alanine amidase n=1 Tax=Sporosarcina sp. HYO08 TaxID=1759557 RepID=UPI00079435A8|nr:N-acetylmuramoyl-L-alanine amidase [Sporosarcina sp. HYO08]KXH79285.1 cell wall hydrolase [Sporosarcina sp. HYO08]